MTKGLQKISLMNEQEQYDYLLHHSTFLVSDTEDQSIYSLYACDDFYIELQFDRLSYVLKEILLYDNIGFIDRYLKKIDLSHLI